MAEVREHQAQVAQDQREKEVRVPFPKTALACWSLAKQALFLVAFLVFVLWSWANVAWIP